MANAVKKAALHKTAPLRAVTRGPGHHSFGYYDKSPWDASGRYLLALQAPFCDRSPGPHDVATLGVVDLLDGDRFRPFAETHAWNWQQGCMLQWLPPDADRLVIYNDRDGDHFVSVICDALSGRVLRRLPLPIYALGHDGRQAVTLNFSRLHRERPGYGYAGVPDPWEDVAAPLDDGIYWLDLETGRHQLIISVAQLAGMDRRPEMDCAIHRFNHLQFSPDDRRFIFLHRWRPGGRSGPEIEGRMKGLSGGLWRILRGREEFAGVNITRRFELGVRGLRRLVAREYGARFDFLTRLCTARPDGSAISIIPDAELVSHFDWRDSRHFLAWARYHGMWGFYLFDDATGEGLPVGADLMPSDGHCSYSPDAERRWILNDTQPDGYDHRTLYLYDTRAERRIDLGRFYSPPKLVDDFRCDLHPRWSRDGRQVCIDSAHEGSRQLYLVDVSAIEAVEEPSCSAEHPL
jgi:hypothetical protein